ncbi:hypothetical protein BDY21DRAFT_291919 [Lineolata rhizophorae]|uniref:Transcription factor RfeG n=1 Tax=Lineolata rhizophorae TaxID=578093 RepID=A0A6A6NR86_9PEZI|nr:hypothetical protein BDY21DRAFT_291919 [Lineolata rhizophorae]
MAAHRVNTWFQPGEGISREVITADIQRYLGPDATVRPGEENGVQGFFITAYRTLTSAMVQDLKLDSQRWYSERQRAGTVQTPHSYNDSNTHKSRQYYGPTEPVDSASASAPGGNYGTPSAARQDPAYRPTASSYSNEPSGYNYSVSAQPPYAQAGYQPTYPSYQSPQSSQTPRSVAPTGYPPGYQQPEGTYSSTSGQYQYPQSHAHSSRPDAYAQQPRPSEYGQPRYYYGFHWNYLATR